MCAVVEDIIFELHSAAWTFKYGGGGARINLSRYIYTVHAVRDAWFERSFVLLHDHVLSRGLWSPLTVGEGAPVGHSHSQHRAFRRPLRSIHTHALVAEQPVAPKHMQLVGMRHGKELVLRQIRRRPHQPRRLYKYPQSIFCQITQ